MEGAQPSVLKIHCPQCGQRIAIEVSNLYSKVSCPRCRAEHLLADLVGPEETLLAVPIPRPATASVGSAPMPAHAPPPVDAWALTGEGHDTVVDARPAPAADLSWWRERAIATNSWLSGRRLAVLVAAGFVASTAAWITTIVFERFPELSHVGVLLCALFMPTAALSLFALEVVAEIEPGAPSWGRAAGTVTAGFIRSSFEGTSEALSRAGNASRAEWLRWLQRGCFGSAAILIMAQPFVTLVLGLARATGMTQLGAIAAAAPGLAFFCLVVGLVLWASRRGAVATMAQQRGLSVTTLAQNLGDPAIHSLPPAIDMVRNRAEASTLAASMPPSVLRELLAALADWRPRRRYESEVEYQASLYRHLVRSIPFVAPEREWNLGGRRGRVDLRIASKINVELKRTMNDANSDRLVGQLDKYLGAGSEREPTVVVVCETPPNFGSSRIGQHVRRLRAAGDPVILVAAGAEEPNWG